MRINPTNTGGRIVQGDTPFGAFRVEWDADGNLVSHEIEIREPEPPKSRGLGDTIAKATKAVGIKPCGGCKKRQEKLNRMFPYRQRRSTEDRKD